MFRRNKEIKESEPVIKSEVTKSEVTKSEIEEKFLWMSGFVLLDAKPTKYEVGNTYGEEHEFTIHENLQSIFSRINDLSIIKGIEIYEVKGYVKAPSYNPYFFINPFTEFKHLATKITIQKELKWKDLKDIIIKLFPMIETKDEYEQAKEVGYTEFAKNKFSNKAIKLGHSETFAMVAFPKQREKEKEIYNRMVALNEEGLSKDMVAYLLLS